MPRPVLALPCGSRSTISTRSPTAASAVPRLIAVVVLPTPPFWFASTRIRGLGMEGSIRFGALSIEEGTFATSGLEFGICIFEPPKLQHLTGPIRLAGNGFYFKYPTFLRFRQFF